MQQINSIGLMVSDKKSFKGYPYRNKLSALGSHLEFPIGTKNITFVEVHPMNIHAMFALNWFTGFRGEIF